jgi:mannose-6-phosphate isomerase-like protein (cupin superfamily)
MEPAARIEILNSSNFTALSNPGVTSLQMLWPQNSPAARVTITRVTLQPGAKQPRHSHASSEQIWMIEHGEGMLLLAGGAARGIAAGDLVRTPAGETHGIENTGAEPLVYVAVTTPPLDFRYAYGRLSR